MEFFHGTNIDFIGKRKFFFMLSIVVTLAGLVGAAVFGIDYGIDFEGGTEVALRFSGAKVQTTDIRHALDAAHFEGSEIKSYGKEEEFLIRLKGIGGQGKEEVSTKVENAVKASIAGADVKVLKVDKIGPKVGAELRMQAIIAIALSVIGILLYIAFRFEFIYGVGAIIALLHDVLVTFAGVVLFNKLHIINLEINQNLIAAFLTVIGFSVHDTVIIFDRIRENKEKHKGMGLVPLMNMSLNETLSRTINTVMTVVLVLLTMVILGGEVLNGFAFTMLVGIVTGAYSSIYIASSFVIWYLENVKKVDVYGSELQASKKGGKIEAVRTV